MLHLVNIIFLIMSRQYIYIILFPIKIIMFYLDAFFFMLNKNSSIILQTNYGYQNNDYCSNIPFILEQYEWNIIKIIVCNTKYMLFIFTYLYNIIYCLMNNNVLNLDKNRWSYHDKYVT